LGSPFLLERANGRWSLKYCYRIRAFANSCFVKSSQKQSATFMSYSFQAFLSASGYCTVIFAWSTQNSIFAIKLTPTSEHRSPMSRTTSNHKEIFRIRQW
jgi:hypothetical protein